MGERDTESFPVVTTGRRSDRARCRCLQVPPCTSSSQIVIMFGVCGSCGFSLALGFYINISIVSSSRVSALSSFLLCFFHFAFGTRLWASVILHILVPYGQQGVRVSIPLEYGAYPLSIAMVPPETITIMDVTRTSREVTHPSTVLAQARLTSNA